MAPPGAPLIVSVARNEPRKGIDVLLHALARLAASLDGLSPLAVLGRGYALVWDEAERRRVRDAAEVEPGQAVERLLERVSAEGQRHGAELGWHGVAPCSHRCVMRISVDPGAFVSVSV